MGGSDQPYIYEPASKRGGAYPYSDFNPRAATQASQQQAADKALRERQGQRLGRDGPLINFNKHPDSYMVITPQQPSNYTPMPANTKRSVIALRWTQFAFRILNEIVALGVMVCVVCIKGQEDALSWIYRLAPAWDIVNTLYAIYHLSRAAKSRTPASSASYHIYALLMDVLLTPFYIFIAMYAHSAWVEAPTDRDRWTSLFTAPGAATTLFLATFIGAAVLGGIHVLCAIFDIVLIVLFRKIANLPPDANPLEDNLTSRSSRVSKHKHKNSEITISEPMLEKKPGYLSGSTLSVGEKSRMSVTTLGDEELKSRVLPWNESANRSAASLAAPSVATNMPASGSQFHNIGLYHPPGFYRSPHGDNHTRNSQRDSHNVPRAPPVSPPKGGATFVEYSEVISPPIRSPARHNNTYAASQVPARTGTDVTDFARQRSSALPNAAPSTALVRSQQRAGLLNDNWFAHHEDDISDDGSPDRRRSPVINYPISNAGSHQRHDSFEPQPLRMNPPTPPPPQAHHQKHFPDPEDDLTLSQATKRSPLTSRSDNGNGELNRHLTVQSHATETSSVYSESAPSLKSSKEVGTPKRKYYGDLAAATRGVRGPGSSPVMKESPSPKKDHQGRVLSRTGVDITDAQVLYVSDGGRGLRGRRDVSGKVAEEGRGGKWLPVQQRY